MKSTDWYSRLLFTISTGLLAIIAAELRTANHLQGALKSASPTSLQHEAAFQAVPALYYPAVSALAQSVTKPLEVRIVGYRYTRSGAPGQQDWAVDYDFGDAASSQPGLPIFDPSKR